MIYHTNVHFQFTVGGLFSWQMRPTVLYYGLLIIVEGGLPNGKPLTAAAAWGGGFRVFFLCCNLFRFLWQSHWNDCASVSVGLYKFQTDVHCLKLWYLLSMFFGVFGRFGLVALVVCRLFHFLWFFALFLFFFFGWLVGWFCCWFSIHCVMYFDGFVLLLFSIHLFFCCFRFYLLSS